MSAGPAPVGFAGAGIFPGLPRSAAHALTLLDRDRPVFTLIALHAIAAVTLLWATRNTHALAFSTYLAVWPAAFFLLFPSLYALVGLFVVVHRFDHRRKLAISRLLSPARVGHFLAGLMLLAALMVFQGAFTSIKNALPAWNGGFPHDLSQAEVDRWLHFGSDPWHLLYAFGQNDLLRALVEWNYNQGWFAVCYGTIFWIAVAPEAREVRTRYFVCYVVTWIVVGNVLAGLFLSAGPAFYHHVTGDTARFADQLAFLAAAAPQQHSAAMLQNYLWSLHSTGQTGIGSGISAFPSMHVGLVMLNALFVAEYSRRWGLVAFAYVGIVLASSVYLAWHYAIDGYASILVTLVIYLAARRFIAGGDERSTA